jgi:deoxyguanosine kinase
LVKAIIIEGPRGTGKSTVTRLLRNQIEGSTLINLTGFKANGSEGLNKVLRYYGNIMPILENLTGDYIFIFDRHFFSEMVYSPVYKSYDFSEPYAHLMQRLVNAVDELEVYYFTISDDQELNRRLNRDKVKLFDSVPENVEETRKQQVGYDRVMGTFERLYGDRENVTYAKIDTTGRTPEEIVDMIIPF